MKSRFFINEEVFTAKKTLNECFNIYDKYFKEHGFVLDKECENVYIDIDIDRELNEGDRVCLDRVGIKIVSCKCINLTHNIIEYDLKDEIL